MFQKMSKTYLNKFKERKRRLLTKKEKNNRLKTKNKEADLVRAIKDSSQNQKRLNNKNTLQS